MHIDDAMAVLFAAAGEELWPEIAVRTTLGCHRYTLGGTP